MPRFERGMPSERSPGRLSEVERLSNGKSSPKKSLMRDSGTGPATFGTPAKDAYR